MTLKKYREGNITAAFSTDLMLQGTTSIPNLLLRYYTKIGITDEEMMVLVQLLRLRMEDNVLYPTVEQLAKYLAGGITRVERDLSSLLKKEVITITQYYDENKGAILSGYDFEPLFEKLSEAWACAKVQEIKKTREVFEKQSLPKEDFARIIKSFEEEFGRSLSPMEIEQIRLWAKEVDYSLILDALRRAVLIGKHNFKYIDGIILKWKKSNLKTVEDVNEYDQQFHTARQQKKSSFKKISDRKKEMIKTLYLS